MYAIVIGQMLNLSAHALNNAYSSKDIFFD